MVSHNTYVDQLSNKAPLQMVVYGSMFAESQATHGEKGGSLVVQLDECHFLQPPHLDPALAHLDLT